MRRRFADQDVDAFDLAFRRLTCRPIGECFALVLLKRIFQIRRRRWKGLDVQILFVEPLDLLNAGIRLTHRGGAEKRGLVADLRRRGRNATGHGQKYHRQRRRFSKPAQRARLGARHENTLLDRERKTIPDGDI
jgi:hypothetical protein